MPVGGVPVVEELYGEALWSVFAAGNWKPTFAKEVTSDGLALTRSFLPGVPFNVVLANRTGTAWPLLPEHVVYSRAWNLSREQALSYVQALLETELGRDATAREIVSRLSRIPLLPIHSVTGFVDDSHVKACEEFLAVVGW